MNCAQLLSLMKSPKESIAVYVLVGEHRHPCTGWVHQGVDLTNPFTFNTKLLHSTPNLYASKGCLKDLRRVEELGEWRKRVYEIDPW